MAEKIREEDLREQAEKLEPTETVEKHIPVVADSHASSTKVDPRHKFGGYRQLTAGDSMMLRGAMAEARSRLKPTKTVERTLLDGALVSDEIHIVPRGKSDSSSGAPERMGHATAEELKEHQEEPKILREKVAQLVKLIQTSKHVVVYTGAGISTSASIPDFRGPTGVWTLRDKGIFKVVGAVPMEQAIPTPAHMALVQWMKRGDIHHLVSQNVDGLHRRSGIPPEALSELHGNCYIETCAECNAEFVRDFDVCNNRVGLHQDIEVTDRHCTGRKCTECNKAYLRDNIIHFGENLPVDHLRRAVKNSKMADLAIVMGTSMRVTPAADLPLMAKKMVIINLQTTPADSKAVFVVHERTDRVCAMVEAGLRGEEIPPATIPIAAKDLQQWIPRFKLIKHIYVKMGVVRRRSPQHMIKGTKMWTFSTRGDQSRPLAAYLRSIEYETGGKLCELDMDGKEPFKAEGVMDSGEQTIRWVFHFRPSCPVAGANAKQVTVECARDRVELVTVLQSNEIKIEVEMDEQ